MKNRFLGNKTKKSRCAGTELLGGGNAEEAGTKAESSAEMAERRADGGLLESGKLR